MAELNDYRPKCEGFLCQARWRKNQAEPEHECPYQREINDDPDYRCTCCDSCRQNCSDDI